VFNILRDLCKGYCGCVDVAAIHCLSKGIGSKGNLSSSLWRCMPASFLSKKRVLVIGDQTQSWKVRLKAPPNFASK
jgi:hypothetical protein